MGWRENFAGMGGHPSFKDVTGGRFGIVVAVSRAQNDGAGNARWNCRCDVCGAEHILLGTALRHHPPKTCPDRRRAAPMKSGPVTRELGDFAHIRKDER